MQLLVASRPCYALHCLRTAKDCVLYSNEPIRNRANILLENVTKWGYENHLVTNNYPKDYRKSKLMFDLILCDVPCSGEGMFRKDEATIREWSEQNVEKCWQLQRDIVDDAWHCLNSGGLFIYSTCTFNTKENEENIRYFLEQYDDMEVLVGRLPRARLPFHPWYLARRRTLHVRAEEEPPHSLLSKEGETRGAEYSDITPQTSDISPQPSDFSPQPSALSPPCRLRLPIGHQLPAWRSTGTA